MIHHGAALIEQGDIRSGLESIEEGWRIWGSNRLVTTFYWLSANGHWQLGDSETAMQLLDDASALITRTDERFWEALDRDDPHVALVCEGARLGRDLAAGTWRAVEPQQRASAGRPELRIAETPAVAQAHGPLEAGSLETRTHAARIPTILPSDRP